MERKGQEKWKSTEHCVVVVVVVVVFVVVVVVVCVRCVCACAHAHVCVGVCGGVKMRKYGKIDGSERSS